MMKIRYALLLSVSCLGLGSLAHAELTPDITPVGKNTSIFTHTSNDTHLASQPKLLSASVIARRTSSDEAIHNNINGSPRRINSPRDDNSDDFLSTHPNPLYQEREYREQATASLPLIGKDRMSRNISQHKELEASRLLLPKQDTADRWLTASVCFITDAGNCSGNEYSGANSPDNSSGGTPGSSGSSSGGDEWDNPFPPEEACRQLGYTLSSCNPGESPDDFCPADRSFFKKCTCTENCPKGYQKTPCGSGMLQTDVTIPNCQTCYRCTACKDDCPQGYDTSMGVCNEISTHLTECGNICYKIISNECSDGSLTAPQETENQKNKIVGYTDCGNPCFKSFDDTCPVGYDKIPTAAGKCYDTAITNFGSTCRKEKPCCQEACPSGSYEYDPGGTGSCGGGTTRNGCNTKTCYYPRYKCPCEDSAYTNCTVTTRPKCQTCYDANSVIWDFICQLGGGTKHCKEKDVYCNEREYTTSYGEEYWGSGKPPC